MMGVEDYARKVVPFQFYTDNGGSIVAIAGNDFAVIGSDTRLSSNYSIFTRDQTKLFELSDSTIMGCSGCWCDTLQLTKVVKAQMQMYYHDNNKIMTTPAVSQLISTVLYYRRFMPYLVYNLLAGLDGDGRGCVYSYDPIGHCERNMFRAVGSSGALLQPLLDNQLGFLNMENVERTPVTLQKALGILKDTFISAAERDIYTGDSLAISVITKNGIESETFDLRKD
ncbi:UNVERIFIED_CONTAM: hypothetical protein PYX00_001559 [Menopon gallinae]|uniref:Proteasome subunit beta type n=1 Tax=Menopon gallinae TaxID=328185 RepID=A0AAW2IDX1_9NEOP